jgi:hypothetical protein
MREPDGAGKAAARVETGVAAELRIPPTEQSERELTPSATEANAAHGCPDHDAWRTRPFLAKGAV